MKGHKKVKVIDSKWSKGRKGFYTKTVTEEYQPRLSLEDLKGPAIILLGVIVIIYAWLLNRGLV